MMLSESYSTYARNSFAYLQHNKLSVLTILLFPLFRYAYLDYQGWYALGGGGIPHNVFGWLVQSLLRLRASRNVRDSSCYDVAMKATELERTSFLDDQLPAWTGNAPKTGVWVAPHRQLEQFASSEIKKVGIFFFFLFLFQTKSSHCGPSSYLDWISLTFGRLYRQTYHISTTRILEPLNLVRPRSKAGLRLYLFPQSITTPVMVVLLSRRGRCFIPIARRRVARTLSSQLRMLSRYLTRAGARGMGFRARD